MPIYQVHQVGVLLCLLDERMPHQLLCTWSILGILVQAGLHKLLELFGEVAGQLGRVVLRDEEENPHRMQVRIWRFALCKRYVIKETLNLTENLCKFNGCDAKAPDVSFSVICRLLDHLSCEKSLKKYE